MNLGAGGVGRGQQLSLMCAPMDSVHTHRHTHRDNAAVSSSSKSTY